MRRCRVAQRVLQRVRENAPPAAEGGDELALAHGIDGQRRIGDAGAIALAHEVWWWAPRASDAPRATA